MATSAADKQRTQLEEQLTASKAEVKTLDTQRSEAQQLHDSQISLAQRLHEEELQGLRHTMHMVVEQLRSTQTEYEAKLATAAAELAAAQASSEQHMDQLARQLGESDFALRQLKSQANQLPHADSSNSSEETGPPAAADNLLEADSQAASLTQELDALKAQLTLTQDEHLSKAESASAKHGELTEEVKSLKSQLELVTQQCQVLAREAEQHETAVKNQAAASADQKAELQAEVSQLQLQSRNSGAEVVETATQLQQAQVQIQQLQQAVERAEQDHQQLAQQVHRQMHLFLSARHAVNKHTAIANA